MEHKTGEQGVTEVYVYVADRAKKNLEIGLEQSVWGWRPVVKGAPRNHGLLESLKQGDYLSLGFGGLGRIDAGEAQGRTVSKLVVTRLTGGLYEDMSPVWVDDVYPYRLPLEVIETREYVTKDDIGPEGIEALRKSACVSGGAFSTESRESVLEMLFEEMLEEYEDELIDEEDPADSPARELTSDLDRRAYALGRVEQKKLRKDKLDGRLQVHCDLCQLLLPTRLVHTAHIRRRSESSYKVRLDPNNLMFACVLGCDSLFEHGYVYVDGDGLIHASKQVGDGALATAVTRLGESCTAFSKKSAPYFAWHRQTIADVKEG